MATINKKSNRDLWVVYYKHPIKGKHQIYFPNKRDAVMACAHWQKIELLVKMELDWESELHKSEKPVTLQEIIDLHINLTRNLHRNNLLFHIFSKYSDHAEKKCDERKNERTDGEQTKIPQPLHGGG